MYLYLHLWIHFSGGDTDERGPAKTSAAVEGWPSRPTNWICYFGGSGMKYSQCKEHMFAAVYPFFLQFSCSI